MEIQIHILTTLQKLYPEKKFLDVQRYTSFNRAMGTNEVREAIKSGRSAKSIIAHWQDDLDKFKKTREKYIMYK